MLRHDARATILDNLGQTAPRRLAKSTTLINRPVASALSRRFVYKTIARSFLAHGVRAAFWSAACDDKMARCMLECDVKVFGADHVHKTIAECSSFSSSCSVLHRKGTPYKTDEEAVHMQLTVFSRNARKVHLILLRDMF